MSFDIPIISVGNITMGGTGKTPMVIYLAKLLANHGQNPGIVSRGYRRNSKGLLMVHDGKELLTNAELAGDEPYLIGMELNNVPIVVSKNRKAGIQALLNNSLVNIILMDDAFQHRRIVRDLDIVTVSAHDQKDDYHLLPWGKLREPLRNIRRADYVIYTKTKQFQIPAIHIKLNPFIKNISTTSIIQPILMKIDETGYHKALPLVQKVFAFCGIGTPNSFIQSVEELSLKISGKRIFHNHQKYNPKILDELSSQIQNSDCKTVVTTEKDMVKLPKSFIKEFEFYVIKIDVVFEKDSIAMDLIKSALFPSD